MSARRETLRRAPRSRQGGPATVPVTWDRVHGGARVECPICGAHKLVATVRGAHIL